MMTGEVVTAEQALEMGMINAVVPDEAVAGPGDGDG